MRGSEVFWLEVRAGRRRRMRGRRVVLENGVVAFIFGVAGIWLGEGLGNYLDVGVNKSGYVCQ